MSSQALGYRPRLARAISAIALFALASAPLQAAEAKSSRPFTRNVAIVVYEGVELLDFAGPGEVFEAASGFATNRGEPAYRVYTVAPTTAALKSQRFLQVKPAYSIADAPKPDVLVLPGGNSGVLTQDPKFMAWVDQASRDAEVTLTVCTGAFVMAKLGRLDGLTATTWYGAIDGLRKAAPKATVQEGRRLVDNGSIITTAGVSAGIDGALHTVARLSGRATADLTARYMEYHWTPEPYLARTYSHMNPSLDESGQTVQRAELFAAERNFTGAADQWRSLLAKSPNDAYFAYKLGEAEHQAGRIDAAIEANQKAAKAGGSAEVRQGALYNLACEYALKGRVDDAVRTLEQAVEAGYRNRGAIMTDPELAAIRENDRFKKLVSAL